MLTRLWRRARRVTRRDAGVSLMELIVAMGLSTTLGAITLFLFVSVSDSSAATNDRTFNTASARNTLQAWSSYLQVSDGTTAGTATNRFEWLTAQDMLFYADLNNRATSGDTINAPTMVWLRIDSTGKLVEEQFADTAVAGSSAQVCRLLGFSVSSGITSTPQLFTAKSYTGANLSTDDLGSAPSSSAGCVSLPETPPSAAGTTDASAIANLQTVSTVEIAFTIVDTKGKHPLEFDSVVTLPSLGATS